MDVCEIATPWRVWCMHVFLLCAERVQKHLFNLVYNWIWPMGMPYSSERWQQMRRGWKEVAGGRRGGQEEKWQSRGGVEEDRRWHMDGRLEFTGGRGGWGRTQHCILSHLWDFISTGCMGEWLAVKSIWHMNIAGAILSPPALLNY